MAALDDLAVRVAARIDRAGVVASAEQQRAFTVYLDSLRMWNRRVNLTAFNLEALTDDAIDRLIVEPAAAARFVSADARRALDVGSGGGSPAIPLAVCCSWLEMRLVESRERKCAFLREVVRQLALPRVTVETRRVESAPTSGDAAQSVDLITIRAVKTDDVLLRACGSILAPGGRVFWFTSASASWPAAGGGLKELSRHRLLPDAASELAILAAD